MNPDLQWALGIVAAIVSTIVTAMIATFRNLAGRISTGNREVHQRIDDIKEKYVRRDDLDGHIQRLDSNVRDLREEMRENHRQVLEVLNRR